MQCTCKSQIYELRGPQPSAHCDMKVPGSTAICCCPAASLDQGCVVHALGPVTRPLNSIIKCLGPYCANLDTLYIWTYTAAIGPLTGTKRQFSRATQPSLERFQLCTVRAKLDAFKTWDYTAATEPCSQSQKGRRTSLPPLACTFSVQAAPSHKPTHAQTARQCMRPFRKTYSAEESHHYVAAPTDATAQCAVC
jgi:hypothetical protein